jgi:hypothetical protein
MALPADKSIGWLPVEVAQIILSRLGPIENCLLSQVCIVPHSLSIVLDDRPYPNESFLSCFHLTRPTDGGVHSVQRMKFGENFAKPVFSSTTSP